MGVKVRSSGTLRGVFSNLEQVTQAATITTINAVTRKAFTASKKAISADTGIAQFQLSGSKKKNIKAVLKSVRANKNRPFGTVFATGKRIGLGRMDARWSKRNPGASFRGRDGIRRTVPGAFIVSRPGGKLVYKRIKGAAKVDPKRGRYAGTGIKRQPLVKLKGPSIPKVFSRPSVQRQVADVVNEVWGKEMNGALFINLKNKNKKLVVSRVEG